MKPDARELPRFGVDAKRAAELSDAELRAEIELRQAPGPSPAGSADPPTQRTALTPREVAQYLANLELREGASPADVDAAHERLVAQYTPGLAATDASRREATELLLRSLSRAKDALLRHMSQA